MTHDQHGFQNVQLLSTYILDTYLGGYQNKFDLHGVIIILIYLLQTNLMFLCFSSQTMRRQTPAVGGSCAKHCRPEAPRRGQHGGQTFRRSYGLSCKPQKMPDFGK